MSKFRTGVEEAAKSQGASFQRVEYFSLEDGESAVVRFLTDYDEWATCDVHTMVPVQKQKPENRQSWPKTVGAVCRKTKLPDGSTLYPDCYICDHIRTPQGGAIKRSSRTYTICVIREQVVGDGSDALGGEAMKGKLLGYRDKMKEVAVTDATGKATGEIEQVRDIRIVGQAWKNFFGHLEAMAGVHKTLLDRDYFIKRKGDDKDTDYQIVHLDPQMMRTDDGGTKVYDLRDPEIAARYGITIGPDQWIPDPKNAPGLAKPVRHYPEDLDVDVYIERQASDEYYGMYFDPTKPQVSRSSSGDSPAQAQTAQVVTKPNTEASADQMAALRARVTDYSAAQAAPPAEPASAPAPAAEAPAPAPQPVPAQSGPITVPDFG